MEGKKEYIPSLDGVRGIAVILVMLVHSGHLKIGWVGVQLFFVLSGYLISKGLLIEKERQTSIIGYLKIFYWKRILRIFPIYFLYLAAFLAVCCYFGQIDRVKSLVIPLFSYTINFYALVKNHVDLNGVGHLWSLAVEEQFYLVWPFIVYYTSLNTFKKYLIGFIIAAPILRFFLFLFVANSNDLQYAGEFVYLFPVSHFDAFSCGALIVVFESNFRSIDKVILSKLFFAVVLLFVVAGIANLSWIYFSASEHFGLSTLTTGGYSWLLLDNLGYVWGYTLLNIFFATVIANSVFDIKLVPFLTNSTLIFIGKISYGIYLYHVPVLMITNWMKSENIVTNAFLLFIIYACSTIIISTLSYKTIESFFMKFKVRLS